MNTKTPQRPGRRARPGWDWLEARSLLSAIAELFPDPAAEFDRDALAGGPGLRVVATTPVSSVPGAPPAPPTVGDVAHVRLSFSQPLDVALFPEGFPPFLLFTLEDGEATASLFDDQPPAAIAFGPDGLHIDVTLAGPLAPGSYRMVVPAGLPLMSLEGEMLAPEEDLIVGDFTVVAAASGPTLADAQDVGQVGPEVVAVPGAFDFGLNPQAVRLYKVELPEGPALWQFGAEATGEPGLSLALSLLDEDGSPIASQGLGRPGRTSSTFLFQGLPAGTYFLGVSGTGHVAGGPGGYDARRGDPGSVRQGQPGGAFSLQLVATPVAGATHVVQFALDRPDPLDQAPAGLNVRFSAAVQLGALRDRAAGGPWGPLELVNAQGDVVPLVLTRFDEARAGLAFLFAHRLSPGTYDLRVVARSLLDLAGRLPVGLGLPSGVLARFTLGPEETGNPRPDTNLSVLFPGGTDDTGPGAWAVAPTARVDLRFVVVDPGVHTLITNADGPGLGLVLVRPDGTRETLAAGDPGIPSTITLNLGEAGVHHLELSATEAGPLSVTVAFRTPAIEPESVIRNGIGQGPALDLRLVSFQPPAQAPPLIAPPVLTPPPPGVHLDPTPLVSAGPAPLANSPATAPATPGPGGQSFGATFQAPPANTVPVLVLGGQLVGRPDVQADQVATVATHVRGGPPLLAANQALSFDGLAAGRPRPSGPIWSQGEDLPPPSSVSPDGAILATRATRPEDEEGIGGPLAAGDWVDQALAALEGLFSGPKAPAPPPPSSEVASESLLARLEHDARRAHDSSEEAQTEPTPRVSLAEPVGVTLLVAALAQQGRRLQRDRSSRRSRARAVPLPAGPYFSRSNRKSQRA